MGADVPDGEIEAILARWALLPGVGRSPRVDSPLARWDCRQPSWRQDVTREIDLVEEVARHYGLDKFPPRLHASKQPAARLPHAASRRSSSRAADRPRLSGNRRHTAGERKEDALFRPAGVRPRAWQSTGRGRFAAALDRARQHGPRAGLELESRSAQSSLFEIGRAYRLQDGAPEEIRIVTIGATGLAREKGVAESPREYGFADLKGDLDQIGDLAGGFGWQSGVEMLPRLHSARVGQISLTAGQEGLGCYFLGKQGAASALIMTEAPSSELPDSLPRV